MYMTHHKSVVLNVLMKIEKKECFGTGNLAPVIVPGRFSINLL